VIHLLQVNPNSGEPIYSQLTDQVTRLIVGGELKPGDELPSVREVAKSLAINPMTVSRSYQTLLTNGLVIRPRGQKMRIAESQKTATQDKLIMLKPLADDLIQQAKELKIDLSELQDLIQNNWK
jgi:GntR family transcriptional regulator